MVGKQRRELVLTLAVPLQPLGEARVQQRPFRPEQAFVGDLASQRMLDQPLPLPLDRRASMRQHEIPLLQHAELRIRSLDELADRAAPEHAADHRSRLQCRLPGPAQQVDARGERGLDGVRHRKTRRKLTERPAAAAAGEHSPAGQSRDQLLHEKRVPLCPFRYQLPDRGGAIAPQQRTDQLLRLR